MILTEVFLHAFVLTRLSLNPTAENLLWKLLPSFRSEAFTDISANIYIKKVNEFFLLCLLFFPTSVNINPDTDVSSADFNRRSVSQALSVESRLGTEAEPSSGQISPVNSQPDPPPPFQVLGLIYKV